MFLHEPPHMPCNDCGASVARYARDEHTCDAERRLDYELFQLRGEVGAFDEQLRTYLESAVGRFSAWYAVRTRPPIQES
ncbi:MAG: hypothetical protein ACRDNX_07185 [Gaiellaceae bacterium]